MGSYRQRLLRTASAGASGLTIGQCATLACVLEAAAPKAGNVHPGAEFDDLDFADFAASAVAIAPAMQTAAGTSVGSAVLQAVQATRRVVSSNTNLGAVLLLAPLASATRSQSWETGIQEVFRCLSAADARRIYKAIRLASPGGLGRVAEMDVAGEPPDCILDAMRAAAGRDIVARQYANGFAQVLRCARPWLAESCREGLPLLAAIVHTQLRLLSRFGDTLIARKCGPGASRQAARRARAVLQAGHPGSEPYRFALGALDRWLRSDGRRRNPGATADLIAAGLFANLWEGAIPRPDTHHQRNRPVADRL